MITDIDSRIWIFCTDPSKTELVNGLIEFREEDRLRAHRILEKIIQSLSFN